MRWMQRGRSGGPCGGRGRAWRRRGRGCRPRPHARCHNRAGRNRSSAPPMRFWQRARRWQGSTAMRSSLYGDTPFIRPETLRAMLAARRAGAHAVAFLGFETAEPGRYGRLIMAGRSADPHRRSQGCDASRARRHLLQLGRGGSGCRDPHDARCIGRQRQCGGRVLPDRHRGHRRGTRAKRDRHRLRCGRNGRRRFTRRPRPGRGRFPGPRAGRCDGRRGHADCARNGVSGP